MWRIKPISALIILALCSGRTTAQSNTFLKYFDAMGVSDIAEDSKNCYLTFIGHKAYRLSPVGEVLWQNSNYWGLGSIILPEAHADRYDVFGLAGELGGFAMLTINNRGKEIRYVYKDPFEEKDTSRTAVDVIFDKKRNQYIAGGTKFSFRSPMQFWIGGFDTAGKMLWENSFYEKGTSRYFKQILPNKSAGGYLLVTDDENSTNRNEIFTVDTMGRILTRRFVEKTDCNGGYELTQLSRLAIYNDSQYITWGYRFRCDPGSFFYILNNQGEVVRRIDSEDGVFKIIPQNDGGLITTDGSSWLLRYDSNFKLMWKRNIFQEHTSQYLEIREVYQSRDGGYYGVAFGQTNFPLAHYAYAFKTDSLGRIFNNAGYSEWKQPMMLQPNPAHGKVRIAIPWYYGSIEAEFYNLQGQLILTQTRNEQEAFDISSLITGVYMVKARNPATGETRNMKLVVN
jgi:hypothetical protein